MNGKQLTWFLIGLAVGSALYYVMQQQKRGA